MKKAFKKFFNKLFFFNRSFGFLIGKFHISFSFRFSLLLINSKLRKNIFLISFLIKNLKTGKERNFDLKFNYDTEKSFFMYYVETTDFFIDLLYSLLPKKKVNLRNRKKGKKFY